MSAEIMMFCFDECKLLWFFPQIRLISVIIAPSSLHWGAVPLLCSHEGTLASLSTAAACAVPQETEHWKMCSLICGGFVWDKAPARVQLLRRGSAVQRRREGAQDTLISTCCWSRALSDMPLPPVYTFYVQNI